MCFIGSSLFCTKIYVCTSAKKRVPILFFCHAAPLMYTADGWVAASGEGMILDTCSAPPCGPSLDAADR